MQPTPLGGSFRPNILSPFYFVDSISMREAGLVWCIPKADCFDGIVPRRAGASQCALVELLESGVGRKMVENNWKERWNEANNLQENRALASKGLT